MSLFGQVPRALICFSRTDWERTPLTFRYCLRGAANRFRFHKGWRFFEMEVENLKLIPEGQTFQVQMVSVDAPDDS